MKMQTQDMFAFHDKEEQKLVGFEQLKTPEGNAIIVIDNFYKQPEAIRELALSLPYSGSREQVYNLPGYRSSIDIDLGRLRHYLVCELAPLICQNANLQAFGKVLKPQFNWITSDSLAALGWPIGNLEGRSSFTPHTDTDAMLAMVVYLNTPEECSGGTAVFKYKPIGSETLTSLNRDAFKAAYNPKSEVRDGFLTSGRLHEEWEFVCQIDMKWNRFVMYKANLFHSPVVLPGTFVNSPRLAQVLWL